MNMKYYTVYKFTYNSCDTNQTKAKIEFILNSILEPDHNSWRSVSSGHRFDENFNSDKDAVQRACWEERSNAEYKRRNEYFTYNHFKDVFMVSQCDRMLGYVPSLGDIKKVLEYINEVRKDRPNCLTVKQFDEKFGGLSAKEILENVKSQLVLD